MSRFADRSKFYASDPDYIDDWIKFEFFDNSGALLTPTGTSTGQFSFSNRALIEVSHTWTRSSEVVTNQTGAAFSFGRKHPDSFAFEIGWLDGEDVRRMAFCQLYGGENGYRCRMTINLSFGGFPAEVSKTPQTFEPVVWEFSRQSPITFFRGQGYEIGVKSSFVVHTSKDLALP